MPDDVTITGNLTASGSTHNLGTIQISGNTLSSTDSTRINVNDTFRANAFESSDGILHMDEFLASNSTYYPRIQSTRSDKVLLFDAIPLFNERIAFEGSGEDDFETVLTVINPTADRTITFGDESGTVLTTGSANAITGGNITNLSLVTNNFADDSITIDKMANDSVGQAQLKDVVDLQIQNASGGILKQIFGAGS